MIIHQKRIILQLRLVIHLLIILMINQSEKTYSMMNQFKKVIED